MTTAAPTERTRVLRMRQVLGLTQREFADEFGVAPAAVAQWESGKRRLPGRALKLLDFYEAEVGLDRDDGAADESGAWVPVGGFARRKAAIESVALPLHGVISLPMPIRARSPAVFGRSPSSVTSRRRAA